MKPDKIDPNNAYLHPVVALRAEGPHGVVRSLAQFLGCLLLTYLALFGEYSVWWALLSVPLALFALVELIGSARYAYLVRRGRADPAPSILE